MVSTKFTSRRVLMNPRLILAVIAGGMAGVFTNVMFSYKLISPASLVLSSRFCDDTKSSYIGVILSVIAATKAVSFCCSVNPS
ncbi:hypothetical protein OH492_13670 [Vibrio chagasii]|nr:hypothetical protein [Vibrio chagasii]